MEGNRIRRVVGVEGDKWSRKKRKKEKLKANKASRQLAGSMRESYEYGAPTAQSAELQWRRRRSKELSRKPALEPVLHPLNGKPQPSIGNLKEPPGKAGRGRSLGSRTPCRWSIP